MSMSPAASAGSSPVLPDKSRGSSKEQAWVIPDDDLPKSPGSSGSAESPIDCDAESDSVKPIPEGTKVDPHATPMNVVRTYKLKRGANLHHKFIEGALVSAFPCDCERHETEPYGDCFYLSVVGQLILLKICPHLKDQQALRQMLADFLMGTLEPFRDGDAEAHKRKEFVDTFFQAMWHLDVAKGPSKRKGVAEEEVTPPVDRQAILKKYSDRMIGGAWGGEPEILMVCIVFGVKVAEYLWCKHEKEFSLNRLRVPDDIKHPDKIIVLSHETCGKGKVLNHYNYFTPKKKQ